MNFVISPTKRFPVLRAITFGILALIGLCSYAQSPDYYYYDPPNVGVNNLYFNTSVSYKFLFIYTQDEMASAGIIAPITISSIWLKSNTGYNVTFEDFKITLGHTTLSVPSDVFDDNFDSGAAVTVLDQPSITVSFVSGPWNDPPNGWTEISLSSPFTYNNTDNLAIQIEYSDDNYPIPLYAYNGGPAIAQYTDTLGGSYASGNTARPMIGFSAGPASPIAIAASDSAVCQKFCTDFSDQSTNNPTSWQWIFPGGNPPSSSDQNPTNICYNEPGVYDVTLITTNANGSDTLTLEDYITVYPTPPIPTITQNGYTLTSSEADFYQWQLNTVDIPGATNQSYEVLQTGFYSVIVTDSNSCKNSTTLYVEITGIDEVNDANISVYPNPSNGKFFIELRSAGDLESISLGVTNMVGQLVYASSHPKMQANRLFGVELGAVPGGIYYLDIAAGESSFRRKMVVE